MRLSIRCFMKTMSINKSFLFWFSNEQINFRCAELDALIKLFQIDPECYHTRKVYGPFVVLKLPSDEHAKNIMSRSVLAHSCMEIWGSGDSMEDLHKDFKANIERCKPFETSSFCMRVETYGKSLQMSQKIDLIETFDYMPMIGDINLKDPEVKLQLVQYYGQDSNKIPKDPIVSFFGRWLADGQRQLVAKISLKTRKFIGNTSMDALLSLLMANLALVKRDDLVFDPFVGSGSLLVAAAVMGGYILGTDIDYLMLHGKTRPTRAREKERAKDENVRANMIQYGVESQYLDVLVADASIPAFRKELVYDSIITDPPYGVREPTEKIGTTRNYTIKEEHIAHHIPSKVDYSLCEIFCDLINFSAKRLRIGGRVVFWLPVSREDYDEKQLPSNPCFKLVANCEQVLASCASRRLLVMEKISEPVESSVTIMDSSASMYRFKFFDDKAPTRKERKEFTREMKQKRIKDLEAKMTISNQN